MPIAGIADQGFWPVYIRYGWLDRFVARRTAAVEGDASFRFHIEPRSLGSIENGHRIVSGEIPLPGNPPRISIDRVWKTRIADIEQIAWLHGFTWLDDLAAVRNADSIVLARDWVFGWIDAFGSGQGPGWTPEVSARRLIRMVHNAYVVLALRQESESEGFSRSIAHHAEFLSRRCKSIPSGIARVEALTGLLYAQISLERGKDQVTQTAAAIAGECERHVDENGSIASRNPEELLQLATLLNWTRAALVNAGIQPRPEHSETLKRAGLALRTLSHFNGALACFHGGGVAPSEYLIQAIAEAGEHESFFRRTALGFARLSSERTSVIVDAAPPLSGRGSENSHASTLAFELVAGDSPIVVNCGSGQSFTPRFARESRETRAHSTVEVNNTSSSRFTNRRFRIVAGEKIVVFAPKDTRIVQLPDASGSTFVAEHDGYVPLFGLTHLRRLDLGTDGLSLWGEDTLCARSSEHRAVFERAAKSLLGGAVPFAVRFHLHPDTYVELDREQKFAALLLPNREVWTFEYEGSAFLDLEQSVYFDKTARIAYDSHQIVLRSHVTGGSAQVRWIFESSPR